MTQSSETTDEETAARDAFVAGRLCVTVEGETGFPPDTTTGLLDEVLAETGLSGRFETSYDDGPLLIVTADAGRDGWPDWIEDVRTLAGLLDREYGLVLDGVIDRHDGEGYRRMSVRKSDLRVMHGRVRVGFEDGSIW